MSAVLKKPKQPKPKPCKAPECDKHFVPRRMGQKTCDNGKCALGYIRAERLKVIRKEKRAGLERLKSLNRLCVEAQDDVNLYVRIRDFGKGCISCDTGKVEDAGHFFPIGAKYRVNRIRFDTRAIHGQCRQCNSYKGGGNLHGYIAGLEKRYGREYVELLYTIRRMADQGQLPRLTKDEVRKIAAEHRQMARDARTASNSAALA